MPPRTPAAVATSIWNLSSLLRTLPSSTSTPSSFTKCSACLFSSSSHLDSKRQKSKRKSQDPYREAQARQRKNANLARQKVLQAERQASLGDPVRSRPTPFIESLRNPEAYKGSTSSSTPSPTANQEYINFYLNPQSMADQLAHSKWLTEPLPQAELGIAVSNDSPENDRIRKALHEQQHQNAEIALQSITSLSTGSSKDLTRVNIQRCIAEFGRHNTDSFLPPKPSSTLPSNAGAPPTLTEHEAAAAAELAQLPKRIGADTGSSEVQIAILTTKINVLMQNLQKKDKHNKRNLRLLVHRRQKLLSYLRRKERGGPRWAHLVEKLGINDAMWKGEISL